MVVLEILFGILTINENCKIHKSSKLIILIITFVGLLSLNIIYSNGAIKTFINFIIQVFLFYCCFKKTLGLSIVVVFVYMILLMGIECIILFLLMNVLNMSKEYCYGVYAGGFISNLIIFVLTIIITYIFRYKLQKIFNSKLEKSNNIVVLSIFTLLCLIILFFDIITNYKDNNSVYSYILLIVIFLAIISNLIKEKIAINDKIQEYNGLLGFMKSYETEIEENKIQNHEIKNQFLTIESMLKDNTPKHKIVDYVKSIINDNKDIDDARYADLQYLPLNGLKGFICSKLNKAEQENLNVSVIVEKDVEKSVISNLSANDFKNLGILLGVYLDNAIEASVLSDKKCLGLEMYLEEDGVLIIITNTFENMIKSNDENYKRISTKGVGRGHGLQLVSKVIFGSKKFMVQSEIMEKVYIQKIIVKK